MMKIWTWMPLVLLTACATTETKEAAIAEVEAAAERVVEKVEEAAVVRVRAEAVMEGRSGTEVVGKVVFEEYFVADGDGPSVEISYQFEGLTPGETRGFHIHEIGDCSAADAMSTGGHFNPHGAEHGDLHDEESHAGDLGNITADDAGRSVGTIGGVKKITLGLGDHNIVGRAVIVHERIDDLKSQPTGDAGGRVSCGVIKLLDAQPAEQ